MDVGRRRKERHVTPPKASSTARVGRAPRGPIEGRRDREHIRTVVVPDHDDLALRLADRIVEVVARETAAKGRCVLGLATGSTPLGIYRELMRRHQAGEVDFSRVVTFNLDEYYPMPADSPHSYRRYMWENLFAHVNIRPEQVHVPDGGVPRETLAEHCVAYERAIAEAGGIDFQMLGIGKSGHIGFNEPGSSPDERTRLVTLDTVTRKDAPGRFFGGDNVPRQAITRGVATLMQRHANDTAYLELAAAAELTRIKTPWVLGPVEWTPELTERAVVWLAEQTGKAILKLTARDYTEHHLSPLLSKYGAAGPINGAIFNSLRDKIRGRRKLPTRKSVVVFSPHPSGPQGSDRSRGRGDRTGPAGRGTPRSGVRRGRPVRPARHPSDVPGGGRGRAGPVRCGAARGLAVPRRVAGVAAHRSRRAGAAVPGRAAGQDPRDLQASVPERHGALPRRARRARVLAARRGPEPGDRRAGRPAGAARVLRDGSLPHSHTEGGRAMNAIDRKSTRLNSSHS